MRDKIVSLHGETTLRKSALRIRGGAGVFEWAMSGKGYRTALEIGTYRGCSAAEMSRYCERVVTIDLKPGEPFDHDAFWRSLGVTNVELRLVKDELDKARTVEALDFDFAFIDGAHDAQAVRRDFALVKICGHVLFHDYDRGSYVERFVNSLPEEQVQVRDIFALWSAS